MARKTHRRRSVTLEQLLAASERLRGLHDQLSADGYVTKSGRLYGCRDGSYTVRLVMRNRSAMVSTVALTIQGVVLA